MPDIDLRARTKLRQAAERLIADLLNEGDWWERSEEERQLIEALEDAYRQGRRDAQKTLEAA